MTTDQKLPPIPIAYRMPPSKPNVPGLIRPRYPFHMLKVGEGIFVPMTRSGKEGLVQSCRTRNNHKDGRTFRVAVLEGGAHAIVRET